MINIVAIPNEAISLQEFLAEPCNAQVIEQLKDRSFSKAKKLKTFLAFYQTKDAVAQLACQGYDLASLNPLELAATASVAIDQGFDKIMKTFDDEERSVLDSLFKD